jgi:hypothetical protein
MASRASLQVVFVGTPAEAYLTAGELVSGPAELLSRLRREYFLRIGGVKHHTITGGSQWANPEYCYFALRFALGGLFAPLG